MHLHVGRWGEPLFDAAGQRELDRRAIEEHGIPGLELMERAGAGLAGLVTDRAPAGPVVVVCGKGNNGGDGYVAARRLSEAGRDVSVVALVGPAELSGDAAASAGRLGADVPVHAADALASALTGAAAVVDAVLGTGTAGEPHGLAAAAIAAINAAGVPEVIACDAPSGVDASTGEVAGEAIRATATATFHAGKPGLWIHPGKAHAGTIVVIDIGLADDGAVGPAAGLIEPAVVESIPCRDAASTKFAAGSVLVCGGSAGLTGAPCLAAEAAMRAGAGYVTAAVPASLELVFEIRLLEVMSVGLPDRNGAIHADAVKPVLDRAARTDATVLGPGLGRDGEAVAFARHLTRLLPHPLVLDADGLGAHRGHLGDLLLRTAPTVLTPHDGELARLLEVDREAVAARRLSCARRAAEASGAIVVLKGDDTLVVAPGGPVAISRGGAPALATAGTGDVLAGVLGACLGKGMEPFAAACAAVEVHRRAGRLAAAWTGAEGVIARDVIEALPAARSAAADA